MWNIWQNSRFAIHFHFKSNFTLIEIPSYSRVRNRQAGNKRRAGKIWQKIINIEPSINVGLGKFVEKNECMALNKPRKLENIHNPRKRRAFNMTVGPGKKSKLISVEPTYIPDNRVI